MYTLTGQKYLKNRNFNAIGKVPSNIITVVYAT